MKKNNLFFNLKYAFSWLWNIDKLSLIAVFALIPINVILPTVEVFIPKVLVDDISLYNSENKILIDIIVITLCVVILKVVLYLLSNFSDIRVQVNSKRIEKIFSEKIMTMDYELFDSTIGRTKYQKARNSLKEYGIYGIVHSLSNLLTNIFGFLIYIQIIAQLNWRVIPILICLEIFGGLVAWGVRSLDHKIKDKRADADRKLRYINNASKDYIAAKDIRLYTMSGYLVKLGKDFVEQRRYWTRKQYQYFLINNFSTAFISFLMTGGTYAYLIYLLSGSNLSAGDVVLYLGVILGFSSWLNGVADNVDSLGKNNRAISDVRDFLELQSSNKNVKSCTFGNIGANDIVLNNICYSYYGSDVDVIKNCNLHIRSGEKIAIVGLNGAGKTTLVKIICGLYSPTKGNVIIDGEDIAKISSEECFSKFSAVFQDVKWMPTSILENVTMKEKKDSDENLAWFALERAGLADKIRLLPNGIFTPLMKNLNEDAVQLSGGELQKLSMARALYKDAPILVLDEPTAALDPIAENKIYLQYEKMTKGKTAIFISHRLSSTKFCDRIVFIKDGAIVEIGSHEELMKLGGEYAKLYKVQSKYYVE